MAGNIYGYQGVHTPLESLTQGRYTLSDYTSMRTELTARLMALENQGGFVPSNVEITGYLHMLPGGEGMGEIETTSSITGASLYINGEAHCGNLLCDNTAVFGGNVTINGGSIISGNGSGLTNINDITKLPLLGGTLNGPLTVTAPYSITGDLIGTASKVNISQTASGNPYYVVLTATLNGSSTLQTDTSGLEFNSGTNTMVTNITGAAAKLAGGVAGSIVYQTAVGQTSYTAAGVAGQFLTSQGSGQPTWTTGSASDPTKLPLSGGTMTGPPVIQAGISCETYIRYNQGPGEIYAPPSNNSKWSFIALQQTNACTVDLVNFAVDPLIFADNVRHITLMKTSLAITDFNVVVLSPAGYGFYSPSAAGSASYSIPAGKFSVTFSIFQNGRLYLTTLV